jgi:hypothetical protein
MVSAFVQGEYKQVAFKPPHTAISKDLVARLPDRVFSLRHLFASLILGLHGPNTGLGVKSMFAGDRGFKVFKLMAETGEIRSVKNQESK